jgi:hypothetical protein
LIWHVRNKGSAFSSCIAVEIDVQWRVAGGGWLHAITLSRSQVGYLAVVVYTTQKKEKRKEKREKEEKKKRKRKEKTRKDKKKDESKRKEKTRKKMKVKEKRKGKKIEKQTLLKVRS